MGEHRLLEIDSNGVQGLALSLVNRLCEGGSDGGLASSELEWHIEERAGCEQGLVGCRHVFLRSQKPSRCAGTIRADIDKVMNVVVTTSAAILQGWSTMLRAAAADERARRFVGLEILFHLLMLFCILKRAVLRAIPVSTYQIEMTPTRYNTLSHKIVV